MAARRTAARGRRHTCAALLLALCLLLQQVSAHCSARVTSTSGLQP
jgi:hypothetical protein